MTGSEELSGQPLTGLARRYRSLSAHALLGIDAESAQARLDALAEHLAKDRLMPHLAAALEWEQVMTSAMLLDPDEGRAMETAERLRGITELTDGLARGHLSEGAESDRLLAAAWEWFEGTDGS